MERLLHPAVQPAATKGVDGMRRLQVLVVMAVAAMLALPAAGAAPPNEISRLKRENAVLRAKVKRLTAANHRLAARNKNLAFDAKTLDQRWGESLAREEALKRHILGVDPCPITRPNNSQPPGDTFGAVFHGNGQIWVGLPRTNIVTWQRSSDGSLDYKFGWWHEVPGKLQINGRRLDGPAPPLRAEIPDGYGEIGFQATGIIFPTDGCWEVTGSVGAASLTFVTLVIAA
jgi:hypothetical protein